jgi:hypothetical protein
LSLICILPFVGLSTEKSHELRTADSLHSIGLTEDAIIAYEYAAYAAESNSIRTIALIKKADCLTSLAKTQSSENTLSRLNYYNLSDSLQYQARYKAALYAYLNKNHEESAAQLEMIQQFLVDSIAMQSKPLYALVLNELRQWNAAKMQLTMWNAYYHSSDSATFKSITEAIDAAYTSKKQPKYKDPAKAQIWAQIIPGSGQLYSGYLFDAAFTSVMVLSGIGIAAYGVLVAKYYVTGIIMGYAVFQRFYIAGQQRSEYLARKKNYKTKRAYNDELRDLITHQLK